MTSLPTAYTVLVVDDEPDMFTLTRMALRRMHHRGALVEIVYTPSAAEGLAYLEAHPDTAVVLLDVVMESEHAGLQACQQIREQHHNQEIRILLRTGQPGAAPEKQVLTDYDIDGYLAKAEMTHIRLFTAVRTALKAFTELRWARIEKESLLQLYQAAMQLQLGQASEAGLQELLEAACSLNQGSLGLVYLQQGDETQLFLNTSALTEPELTQTRLDSLLPHLTQGQTPLEGLQIPLQLAQPELQSWLYLDGKDSETLTHELLPWLQLQVTAYLNQGLLGQS